MVTSRDVAKYAGVSQTTVSRVLSESRLVTADTRKKVEDAIRATGYTPDNRARALKTQRSGNIGVVVAELSNPFYAEIVQALNRAIEAQGMRMSVWVLNNESRSRESVALRAIRQRSIDGVIFTSITPGLAELQEAVKQGSPFVLMNRVAEGLKCDVVTGNDKKAGRLVAEYLLQGRRKRAAFIGGLPNVSTTTDRLKGFQESLSRGGHSLDSTLVCMGEFSYEFGFNAMSEILKLSPDVDSVYCSTDLIAFGVIDSVKKFGMCVPEDIWVVGHDDVPAASWESYSLTTLRVGFNRAAHEAVRLVLDRISEPRKMPEWSELEPSLVIRASTGVRDGPLSQRDKS